MKTLIYILAFLDLAASEIKKFTLENTNNSQIIGFDKASSIGKRLSIIYVVKKSKKSKPIVLILIKD